MSAHVTGSKQFCLLILIGLSVAAGWLFPQDIYRVSPEIPGLESIYLGGTAGWGTIETLDNGTLTPGWRGGSDVVLADDGASFTDESDLIATFDRGPQDVEGYYRLEDAVGVSHISSNVRFGAGSLGFPGSGSVVFAPQNGSIFTPYTHPGSFVIDIWLYPVRLTEGATILQWRGALLNEGTPVLQEFSFAIQRGRLRWKLTNLVTAIDEDNRRTLSTVTLSARRGTVPQQWTHHRFRYDATTGQIAYLVDGVPEEIVYLTGAAGESGGAGAVPASLLFGENTGSGLVLGEGYTGLADEFRIERNSNLPLRRTRFSGSAGEMTTEIIALGSRGGVLHGIHTRTETPGNTDVRTYYRLWNGTFTDWQEVPRDGILRGHQTGQVIQLRTVLLADASGTVTPRLQEIEITFRPFAPPPAPRGLRASSAPGAVRLTWDPVLAEGIAGYHVLIGERPGRYLGAPGVISPVSVFAGTEIVIEGLEPDRSYVFAIESVDRYGQKSPLSREIEARAGRVER